jgi:hypothetical protein
LIGLPVGLLEVASVKRRREKPNGAMMVIFRCSDALTVLPVICPLST